MVTDLPAEAASDGASDEYSATPAIAEWNTCPVFHIRKFVSRHKSIQQ
jgi:hypothetical protein